MTLKKSIKTKNSGFTMIEILVSILLLGSALSAVSYAITLNLSNAALVRDSFVASGLLQEGVEVVTNLRDQDAFAGNAFGTSMPDGTYRVQWDSQTLIPLGGNPTLAKDAATGMFGYYVGTATPFTRILTLSTIVVNVEKRLTTTVSWSARGVTRSISAEKHLYNWQ